jgi:hypothetical protein
MLGLCLVPILFCMMWKKKKKKVFHLYHYSKKLVIAFGFINIALSTPLRTIKSLQACEDCHISTQFISKIVGKTIMVKDANHFHHFEDDVCSCMDYRRWQ